MYPLIEIKTVPIEIEMKTTYARLEYTRATAEMEITRDKGGTSIKTRPIKLNIDTFEARNSISPTPFRSVKQSAEQGRSAAYEATATYAQQGQLLVHARMGEELIPKFAEEAMTKDLKPNVGIRFLPEEPPKITWDQGEINIRYEMDKLNFDWRTQKGAFEFVPGDIEISITQQPDLLIKYVGGALYVPPSADPNYEPVDVQA